MAHQRKLIRAAVVKALLDKTSAGKSVYPNRAKQLFESDLPAILVYTKNEPASRSGEARREYERNLRVLVEITAQQSAEGESLDDTLDDLCEVVEKELFRDIYFGGVASDMDLVDTEMDIISEGKKPIGAAIISLDIKYYSDLPGPTDDEDGLNNFARANVKIDMAPTDGQIDSEDDVELPQV